MLVYFKLFRGLVVRHDRGCDYGCGVFIFYKPCQTNKLENDVRMRMIQLITMVHSFSRIAVSVSVFKPRLQILTYI
jgi:hypothetical protein